MQHIPVDPSSTPVRTASGYETARFFAVLFRYKWFIIASVVVTTAISVYAVLNMPNWFAATVNLVPPKTAGLDGLAGSLSSTLKDFGLSKLAGGASDGYSYMVILQSRRLQDSLIHEFDLARVYDMPPDNMSALRDALGENLEILYEKEGNYLITAWHTDRFEAARMANRTAEIANAIANEIVQTEATNNRRYAERRLRENQESFRRASDSLKAFTRRYNIFSPPEQAAAAATALADMKAQVLHQEMRAQMYESLLGADDPATLQQKRLYAELRAQMDKVETQPGFVGNFPLKYGSEIGVEYMRLLTDVEVYAKLKAFLLPMLEQYKLDEQRTMPNLYVLDPAVPPDKKGRPKRSLIVAGTALGTFVLAVLVLLLWDRYRIIRQTYFPVSSNGKVRDTAVPADQV